jgi:hypothetical protein
VMHRSRASCAGRWPCDAGTHAGWRQDPRNLAVRSLCGR